MPMTKPTSEQVTFLAAGAGATQRTALDKLRDVVNVKDFGAVGNGVANDTAAFNAAWAANNPNPVFVPGGSYAITGTVTGSFVTNGTVTIVGGTVVSISTYGVNAIIPGNANVSGNITAAGTLSAGGTTLTGDLAVNASTSADITTTTTTATVFNTNATTLNVGGAATTLSIGATTGTASINNATFRFNSGYGSVATAYGCRAWCNFDGTATSPISPRSSGNVSSITKHGTGTFTVAFSVSMPDVNYSVQVTAMRNVTGGPAGITQPIGIVTNDTVYGNSYNTPSVRIATIGGDTSATAIDCLAVNVSIFR